MSQTELLLKEIEGLPAGYMGEILDFVGYLKHKCPLCAEYGHIPNEETIAAIEEGRAMMRGEIPANRYESVDEVWKELGL